MGMVVAMVLALVAVVLTGYAQGRFTERFELTVESPTLAEGIVAGADVKFRGYVIGTVTSVDMVGYGHQRIGIALEPDQARGLTSSATARFSSSNIFGATGVELIDAAGGTPLREHAVLTMSDGVADGTVAGVLRRVAELARIVDSDGVRRLFDLLEENSGLLGSSVRSLVETARMLTTEQRAPLAHYLEAGAELSDSVAHLTPSALEAMLQIIDESAYFGEEANRDRTNKAVHGLNDDLLLSLADTLRRDNPLLAPVLSAALDLAMPIALSAGTVAPAYNRLAGLIDNIRAAFPVVDGRVQMQLEVIVGTMPYLADSLTPNRGGSR